MLKERFSKRWDDFSQADFDFLFDFLTAPIKVIPKEEYVSCLNRALEIAPHEEDAPYLALAMHLNIPIWSNDSGIKNQTIIKVLSTNELIKEID